MSALAPREREPYAAASPHHHARARHHAAPTGVHVLVHPAHPSRKSNPARLVTMVISILLVALFGYALLRIVTSYSVGYERARLVSRVSVIGQTFDAKMIQRLTGREADEGTPAFRSIIAHLARLQTDNRDCRFVYLMGRKNGVVIFLADGTDPGSPDYSPPGEVYEEASPALIGSFANGEPFVEGPVTDRWGTWVSGLAPIRDPSSQRVVAVVGMDVNAARWGITLGIGRALAGLATCLLAWAVRSCARRLHA